MQKSIKYHSYLRKWLYIDLVYMSKLIHLHARECHGKKQNDSSPKEFHDSPPLVLLLVSITGRYNDVVQPTTLLLINDHMNESCKLDQIILSMQKKLSTEISDSETHD